MKAGAQILVRTCANIQVGENVAIVTDPERIAIARELAREVEATGGIPSILMPPPRAIDNAEPGQLVAAALKAADVV
ncbi:MAG: hypothetical protein HOE14_11465, partial [Gemmatimonadales bacterium]|nr:hypothetical protein [Gemmatimonadales bacterium]